MEMGSQVSFMASIYRSASKVIAWLGEEDDHTEESFALIRKLATLSQDCLKQILPENMGSGAFAKILGPLADSHAWNSLRQFWRRSYFTRVWIIQEVELAKQVTVKCGGHLLDWDHVVQVSLFLTVTPWARFLNPEVHETSDREYSNHALPVYLKANGKVDASGERRALLYALIRARRFQCTDPRDKVYALLGLGEAGIKQKPRLQPIYGDHSVVDTYISTAIQILEDADDLLLLAHAEGQGFQRQEGLPSWVPDWSFSGGLGLGIIGYERFSAAGDLPRSLKINEANMSLALRGLQLDQVVQVGESKDEALISKKPAHFPGWISILSALPMVYHTGQPRTEVFWRTLITDTAASIPNQAQQSAAHDHGIVFRNWFPHSTGHPAADEHRHAFRDWIARIVQRWKDEPSSMEKTHFLDSVDRLAASDRTGLFPSVVDELGTDLGTNSLSDSPNKVTDADSSSPRNADDYDATINHSSQTRLLRTGANYLGLATTSVRECDSVWIIAGSRVPLILRESGVRNEYQLVGGAYLHGFMKGEALTPDAALVDIKVV